MTSLKNNWDSQSSLPSAPSDAVLPSSGATENLITAALELLKLALSQVNQNEAQRIQFAERTYQCNNAYQQGSDQQVKAALICSAVLSLADQSERQVNAALAGASLGTRFAVIE